MVRRKLFRRTLVILVAVIGFLLSSIPPGEGFPDPLSLDMDSRDVSLKAIWADVKAYGAKGDGLADDGKAISAAVAAINKSGTGTLYFPPGEYRVFTGSYKGSLGGFSNINGLSLISNRATLTVDLSRKFRPGESYYGFTFDNCTNVFITGFVVRGPITDISSTAVNGVEFVRFRKGCSNIAMPYNKVSGMLSGVILSRLPSDPESYHVRNVNIGTLLVDHCYYGFNTQHTGRDVTINELVTDTIHRSYFVYGARNHKVNITSRNDYANDCYINAFNGYGCEDLWIKYTNTESTRSSDFANHVTIAWGDTIPATHRGIHLDVNIVYQPGQQSGASGIYLFKYDEQNKPDVKDRGHRLEDFTITGSIRGAPHHAGAFPVYTLPTCNWGDGDFWSNIRISDLKIINSKNSLFRLTSLVDTATITNLSSERPFMVKVNPRGKAIFINSDSTQFTESATDNSYHEYISCRITDNPSYRHAGGNGERNKRFTDTYYGSRYYPSGK